MLLYKFYATHKNKFKSNQKHVWCVNTIELCKEALDKGNSVVAILMDLSKAFDTVIHVLSIAKLEAYSFSKNFLNYIQSYLRNCAQTTNVNNNFSLWEDIFTGVWQRCTLRSLMFNIYINDIFLFTDNICLSNYADDNTLYSTGENTTIIETFQIKIASLCKNGFMTNKKLGIT